jgi:hypothetical protein
LRPLASHFLPFPRATGSHRSPKASLTDASNIHSGNGCKLNAPTIRARLFKIGGLIRVTTRRVWAHFSSSYPYRELFAQVLSNLRRHAEELAHRSRGAPDLPLPGDGLP